MGNLIEKQLFPIQDPTNSGNNIQVTENGVEYIYIERRESKKVILYSHANGAILDEITIKLRVLSKNLKVSIIAYEYPKNCTHWDSLRQIEKVYDFVKDIYLEKDIILMGVSIGCGPTLYLAQLTSPGIHSVILVSPFTSVKRLIVHKNIGTCLFAKILSLTIDERFDNKKIIQNIYSPLLILHGEDDTLIPHIMSRELYHMSNSDKKKKHLSLIPNIGHDLCYKTQLISTEIQKFFLKITRD